MKKTYSKPEITFESFATSTSIAAGCEVINATHASGTCGFPTRNGVIFVEGVTGCEYIQPDQFDGICYHVPINTSNVFNS